ncbi:hypothetical protein ANN_18062 [Periplaneta americana]|uniref:Uncharacterized protein n=1 Tax=Periplaneta americana TaxID=6978 RepID=A0ABQ8SMQ3_PERAM|nr:hypothetical protein ANN_18062 [Periplaneta americana]
MTGAAISVKLGGIPRHFEALRTPPSPPPPHHYPPPAPLQFSDIFFNRNIPAQTALDERALLRSGRAVFTARRNGEEDTCETWNLTLREEHRLRMFENKVLRKIFGAKRDEVTGEWRKLYNTELHALYSSPDIIGNAISRRLRWAGHVARMGESRNECWLGGRREKDFGEAETLDSCDWQIAEVTCIGGGTIFSYTSIDARRLCIVLKDTRQKPWRQLYCVELKEIFGAKRDEVTGEWRKLHNTELHALYSSPDIIRNIKSRCLRWAGHVARMGESRNAYRVSVGRPEGKRPLGRSRRSWEDNIKVDLSEVGYDDRE